MIEKLEYHEAHDDKRFSQITDAMWTLRLENAQRATIKREIKPTDD